MTHRTVGHDERRHTRRHRRQPFQTRTGQQTQQNRFGLVRPGVGQQQMTDPGRSRRFFERGITSQPRPCFQAALSLGPV